ncbi:MAG: DUF4097 family beta strand repeat protein [Clostridia bacterium]|nr:DUF4097 family beta strand repeat protein [Clostridia bacterium]
MKNKGVIVIMIILLSFLSIGLAVLLFFMINGNFKFGFNMGKRSEEVIFEEFYEADSINNIEILSSAGDVKFEESTDGKLKVIVYGQNDGKLKVDFYDNKLKVDYSENNKINFFGINFYTNDIIVYIPKSYDKSIKVDLDYGNINVLDLEKATIDIKADCGDVRLGTIKNVTIKNDYGNVEIGEVLNKLNIDSDCGDIKIEKVQLQEDSKIKLDLGDVKISEINDIYVDANVDLGECKINSSNRHSDVTLKIDSDCGDVKVGN